MNDELLLKQARLVGEIGREGERLHRHFMGGDPNAANLSLNGIFQAVDALRDTVRTQPYYPAMGESVTLQRMSELVPMATGEKPAMKRLRDFNVGDEVWVKVKIRSEVDEDGEVIIEAGNNTSYVDASAEAHQ